MTPFNFGETSINNDIKTKRDVDHYVLFKHPQLESADDISPYFARIFIPAQTSH